MNSFHDQFLFIQWSKYTTSTFKLTHINLITSKQRSRLTLRSLEARRHVIATVLLGDGQKQLEFRRKFLLWVQAIRKVNAADSTVGVNLHSQCLNVIGSIGTSGEVRQVELDLIPAFVQSHRHCANEWFHTRCWLTGKGTMRNGNIWKR